MLELCIIRKNGWITGAVWIDHEDLFAIHPDLREAEVRSDEWGTIPIVMKHGDTIEVPCHYIDC
uniref:Uncharacterized protein n=1 Tax=virus sp. ctmTa7 TaxID=2828255 RepID=A0A8S5RCS5_9VIRU|nr:MAG TPA: hypothetical protein [virus sp. ctmTa7]